MRLVYYCLSIFLLCPVTIYTQAPLDPNNSVDWTLAGLENEIPTPTIIVNVITDGGVVGDASSNDGLAIQTLIDNAAPGTELYFPPASYLINNTLRLKSGVSLRGECPSTSKLLFAFSQTANPNAECIEVLTFQYGSHVAVTGSYSKTKTAIKVSEISGFAIGSYAEIQLDNDPDLMYTNPTWNQSWAQDAVGQIVKVTNIVNDSLYFYPPLNIQIDQALSPSVRPTGLIENVKISDLYIERLDAGDGHTIEVKNASNCLIENIESRMTFRSHINVAQSLNIEVRNSYLHMSHDYGGGGHAYGVDLNRHTTNCLVENNIFETLRHSMMVHIGANGNVFGYNYSRNPTWEFSSVAPDISIHGHYPSMNLFEGNIVQRIAIADYWGPSGPGNTYFRNRVETDNIDVFDFSHDQNIVGNELSSGSNQISISSGIINTFVHGNNVNGTITWDNSVGNQLLPASLYLNIISPYLGPELPLNSGNIPAKQRYETNDLTFCDDENQASCKELLYSNMTASGGDPSSQTTQEGPQNINDGNLNGDISRWSRLSIPPNNLAAIEFELNGGIQSIDYMKIAWWQGDVRTADFDIYTSIDGINFTPVQNGNNGHYMSDGMTSGFEYYDFSAVMASHIRIVGYGNSVNNWVSISEVEVRGNCHVDCLQHVAINDPNLNSNLYQANQTLTSSARVRVPRIVRFKSNEIHLLEGFEVEEGAVLIADIDGCI